MALTRCILSACAAATAVAMNIGNPHLPATSEGLPLKTASSAACPIAQDTDIVVYTDNGVGPYSRAWTLAFYTWWAAANVGTLNYMEVSAVNINTDCSLLSFPNLKLFTLPGGAADNTSQSLGTGGRDNLLDWIYYGFPGAHFMGTCAGMYYAAGSYWWDGEFYGQPWAPHWIPTTEGPIHEIASYPAYAPTLLSNGLTVVYYGGPGSGIKNTTSTIPGEKIATYVNVADGSVPAVVRYGSLVLFSPHPEAVEGVGLECAPPLPAGCITEAQRLANWRFLASTINDALGTAWVIPESAELNEEALRYLADAGASAGRRRRRKQAGGAAATAAVVE